MTVVGPFRLQFLGLLLDLLLRLPHRQRPGVALPHAGQRVVAARVHDDLRDMAVLFLGQRDRGRYGAFVQDAFELAQRLLDEGPQRRRDLDVAAGDGV